MTQLLVERQPRTQDAPTTEKTSERQQSRAPRLSAPPVILLGGEANALSVARQLGRMGVKVYALCPPDVCVRHSRHVEWIPTETPADDRSPEAGWARFLLGPDVEHLRGAVVLSCSDAGIQLIARHRDALLERYLLDDSEPASALAMLDKRTTYLMARAAGVPTPKFWIVERREQIVALKDEMVFPLIVKPRLSHIFESRFGKKYLFAQDFDRLLSAFDESSAAELDVMLVEYLPGDDDKLSSYFTYIDANGAPLLHYTKRVVRRYPAGMGAGCYHISDPVPEIAEPSLKLAKHAGLRGLVNVEFKLDPRDGVHKLIESNARFVGSNALVAASGCDLAAFVYSRLTGRPLPWMEQITGMRLRDPIRDWYAFLERRRSGQITFASWLASICHLQMFPYFEWTDPMPTISRLLKPLGRFWSRRK